MYKNFNDFTNILAQFEENEKCIVTEYLGKYTYKVKYKEWVGYVKDDFLDVNEYLRNNGLI